MEYSFGIDIGLRRSLLYAFCLCAFLFVSLFGGDSAFAFRPALPEKRSAPDNSKFAENSVQIESPTTFETATATIFADISADGSDLSGDGVDISRKDSVQNPITADQIAETSPSASTGTIVVSKDPGGDYSSIQEAIDHASEGDSIVVQSGIYYESLVVDKTLEIRSETGDSGDVAVSARDGLPAAAVSGNATVRLSGLSLYGIGGNSAWTTVGASARLELDDLCIGWGYAKAGKIRIKYDEKGRVASSESAGSFHDQINGARPDMKRFPENTERIFDQ